LLKENGLGSLSKKTNIERIEATQWRRRMAKTAGGKQLTAMVVSRLAMWRREEAVAGQLRRRIGGVIGVTGRAMARSAAILSGVKMACLAGVSREIMT
jgi:hypothetical protein